MTVFALDPLTDSRWTDLVTRDPRATVFHACDWLHALRDCYGYEPVAFTTSAPHQALENAVVFCEVRSWLTGRRLVSLPFSDHCEPLVADETELTAICRHLEAERRARRWRYIELRPQELLRGRESALSASAQYWLHLLDLRPGPEALFRSLHASSIQRKVRRAQRELTYDEGHDDGRLQEFFQLLILTRRRHGIPPQPIEWFRTLQERFGTRMTVRIARHKGAAVAGIVTLCHGNTMVYKYGASDAALHQLGGMQLLLWKTTEEACQAGCSTLDLGRSDLNQEGLRTFKDRWGARCSRLVYQRLPADTTPSSNPIRDRAGQLVRTCVERAPAAWRVAAGRVLYRHVG